MARHRTLPDDLSVDEPETQYRAAGVCLERLGERIDAQRAAEQCIRTVVDAENREARR